MSAGAAPSLLATWLKEQWAWGRFSPQEVQHIAALAQKDMKAFGCNALPSNLCALAEMGTYGKHPNNVHRDLMKLVQPDSKLPEPFFVTLLCKGHDSVQAVMLPHLVFHALWKHYRAYWEAIFLPSGVDGLVKFWKHFASHPCMAGFKGTTAKWQSCTLPLYLHGGGVPTIGCGKVWAKLMQAYSWSCLLARGTTRERSLYLWGGFDQTLKHGTEGTLQRFFDVLKWSFTALQAGKFPHYDWKGRKFQMGTQEHAMAGTLLADGFCGHLVSIQGGLDWYASSLDLPRWNLKAGGCNVCSCTQEGEKTWKRFNDPEHILSMEWMAAQWHKWTKKSRCPLFTIPFLSACNVMLDYLHLKLLGSDQYQFGGCFFLLTHVMMPLASPLANLQALWQRMQHWYHVAGTRHKYHYFNRLTMFVRKSGPPKLRGRGAEVAGLGTIMVQLWMDYYNPLLEIHRMILQMLRCNQRMEFLMAEYKDYTAFPADAAQEFKAATFQMSHLNALVHQHFLAEPEMKGAFAVTIKLHMLAHLALHCHEISPRLIWNFSGEDNMSVVKKLGQSCAKGLQPEDVNTKMVQHWRFAMHQELRKMC
eukprot:Skav205369  [mRNA]  locus=scaffold2437:85413:87176:+ [translate_table: standard]